MSIERRATSSKRSSTNGEEEILVFAPVEPPGPRRNDTPAALSLRVAPRPSLRLGAPLPVLQKSQVSFPFVRAPQTGDRGDAKRVLLMSSHTFPFISGKFASSVCGWSV